MGCRRKIGLLIAGSKKENPLFVVGKERRQGKNDCGLIVSSPTKEKGESAKGG
jgi:hypothetical protein